MEQGLDTRARAQWLRRRRQGIGGTDAAAILGLSPWATAYEVWLDKNGALPERPRSEAMNWGLLLEPAMAARYEQATGCRLTNPARLFYHPKHKRLLASPDRLVKGERRGVEFKTAHWTAAGEWGPAGGERIPAQYEAQVRHYMAVLDYECWDVAVLIGGCDWRLYTLQRDMDTERRMVPALVEWWDRYMEGGEVPPITGAESTERALAAQFPKHTQPAVKATRAAERYAAMLEHARGEAAEAGVRVAEAANNLKALLGHHEAMAGDGWRVTWKAAKDGEAVDWEAVARRMAARFKPAEVGRLVRENTARRPGPRRFLFTVEG